MNNQTNVIISGGGTGGHIYPAIAIANALKAIEPDINILFVGALGKMEMEKVPKAGFKIIGLPITGIQRSLSFENLKFPFKLAKSFIMAKKIIKDFKPNIAIGVGGYASGPLLLAANQAGIPTLIQEQNSFAGITNKYLAKKAKAICVAYTGMEKFFPEQKIIFTGNPVRSDILEISSKKSKALAHFGMHENKKTLLIIGGSLGAKTINESIDSGLQKLLNAGYQIIWQTGKLYIERAKKAAENYKDTFVSDFIYEMDLAYAAADIVISRAGALSVSELCLAVKPSILVPYPFAAEDHQTQNALNLVNKEAAIMVADIAAKSDLIDKAILLLNNPKMQQNLSVNISKLGKPKAADEIATEIFRIINVK
jgi:UDP-N-acetylglucosamine--N-acetylmuramyl-(pentapeptide) pyrophosphoryl-undecaprenol N-acetylglucosamine transferase